MFNRYALKGILRDNATPRTLARSAKHLRKVRFYDNLKLSRDKTNKFSINRKKILNRKRRFYEIT